ncbi:MAG: threonylcarbamoyl-AMP synthase [Chloroflexi bacterium]|nr:threonylcarbamoyl-AMP synthase [Chloroflexota bacterium]
MGRDTVTQGQIEEAARVLGRGGVIAVPTDTLYGLASRALDEKAAERIFRLKGRPKGMALPLLLAEPSDISRYAADVPYAAWRLVEKLWPGALTIVLKKSAIVPDVVSGGMDTIALRVPNHHVPREVAQRLGEAITGTSANRSGRPGLTTAQAVREEFGGELDLIVDGGETPGGVASTVLDLTGKRPRILRQGVVSRREIEEACGVQVEG